MPKKTPQEDRYYDYAPYTPYKREEYVRIFYVRYSPAANRRQFFITYGSVAAVSALMILSLLFGGVGHYLAGAICAFAAAVGIVYLALLYRHTEKYSWIVNYKHYERTLIRDGKPLYRRRDQILEDRVVTVIGFLIWLAGIGGMIWQGVNCIRYFWA